MTEDQYGQRYQLAARLICQELAAAFTYQPGHAAVADRIIEVLTDATLIDLTVPLPGSQSLLSILNRIAELRRDLSYVAAACEPKHSIDRQRLAEIANKGATDD